VTAVEIVHEALIDNGHAHRLAAAGHRRSAHTSLLTEATQEWADHEREDSYLYRGLRLAAASDWATRKPWTIESAGGRVPDLEPSCARHRGKPASSPTGHSPGRGQAIFELEAAPEKAMVLALRAGDDGGDIHSYSGPCSGYSVGRRSAGSCGWTHRPTLAVCVASGSADAPPLRAMNRTIRLWDAACDGCWR